jgi:peptidoglycan/LPS O-acetylase OafA/YrhL
LKELAIAASLNFFVLPYLNSVSWAFGNTLINGPTFPFNSPSWSLFFELFVNILFFFSLNIMRHSRNIIRPIAAIFFAIFLLLTIHYRDFNPGWGTQNFLLGFPRVIAEFFFGAVLYDFHRHISVTNLGPKLIVVALSIFCFLMPTNKTRFVMIFILAPALIFLASNLDLPKWANLACTQLGAISYPLYIAHYAFFKIAFQLSYFSGLEPAVQSLVGSASALLFATVCAGFDSRARKYLRNS